MVFRSQGNPFKSAIGGSCENGRGADARPRKAPQGMRRTYTFTLQPRGLMFQFPDEIPDQLPVVGTHLFEFDSLTILTHPHDHASRINVLTRRGQSK
jgi:hypothetical protein